ncbi:MAG: hypothetical protein J7M05_00785, partial [Anaerolineae bacterium]|nr:hypothetical protein [Anaerolineae bacterium]
SSLMPRGYPTPMWASASMGGYFGAELKYAGYDGIIIQGRADTPCYLLIEDDKVSLEDAQDLWGKGTFATQQELKARHSKLHQIAAIGPAGENLVRFACITHRLTNAVGNGGFGGVMGSKKLKAIVVRGTRGFPIAQPEAFLKAVADVWYLVRGGLSCIGKIEQGFPYLACTHGCSVKCWTRIYPAKDRFGSASQVNMTTCVDAVWRGGSGEYKARSPQGKTLNIPKIKGFGGIGIDLANLAEAMGITAWAYHTWGRYFRALKELGIDEIDGEPLDIDNPEWWRDWILNVSYRRGLGNDIAEDFCRFYEKHPIGPPELAEFTASAGSRGHGWHREGRLMEPHPSPFWEYGALLYAVSTRDVTPSTHGFFFLNGLFGQPSEPKKPEDISISLLNLVEKVYGSRKAIYPGTDYIEHVVAWHQYRSVIKDSMGLCDWVFPVLRKTFDTKEEMEQAVRRGESIYGDLTAEARLFQSCTGIDLDIKEMEQPIAERIVNLERAIEIRNNGRERSLDEAVIPHFQWPSKVDGTHLSEDAHEFRELLDRYYELRGWDKTTGWPKPEKLRELGLDDVAETLESLLLARAR